MTIDRDKFKVIMIVAVSKALGYQEELKDIFDPNYSEIYQKILPEIDELKDKKARMAMIAAISKAMKYRQENPQAQEKEILDHVMKETDSIIDNVEKFS